LLHKKTLSDAGTQRKAGSNPADAVRRRWFRSFGEARQGLRTVVSYHMMEGEDVKIEIEKKRGR